MPGVIPHLIAGSALYFIGRYSFRSYFQNDQKYNKRFLLLVVCILFSLLPDFFLGIYYISHLEPKKTLMPYQIFTHHALTPIVCGVLLLLIVRFDTKRKPIWIMGIGALILHIIMDLFIQETNYLI
jgi:Na+/melibiose symporter-like transporter